MFVIPFMTHLRMTHFGSWGEWSIIGETLTNMGIRSAYDGMELSLIDRWDFLQQSVYISRALETISYRIGTKIRIIDTSLFHIKRESFVAIEVEAVTPRTRP